MDVKSTSGCLLENTIQKGQLLLEDENPNKPDCRSGKQRKCTDKHKNNLTNTQIA